MAASGLRLSPLRDILRLLRPHAAGEGAALAGGIALSVVVVLFHVARPWPVKWLIDALATHPQAGQVADWARADVARGIAVLALALVAIAICAAVAEYAQVIALNGLGNRVVYRFRTALFTQLLRQPLAFHESREVGELLTRVVYDTSRLRRGVNGILIRVFQTIALFVATLVVLVWLHPGLGTVFGVGGLIALVMMKRRGRRIARAAGKQRRKEGQLAAVVGNELLAVRERQTFGLDELEAQERFTDRNERSLRQEQKVRKLAAGLVGRIDVLFGVMTALALWWGATAVLSGRLTPGDLSLFFSYALSLRGPFSDFAYQTGRLGRTYAGADRLGRIMNRVPDVADRPNAVAAPPLSGEIALEGVTLKAPRRVASARRRSIDRVSLSIPAGTRVGVIGGNGAGKSTLLRLVLRLADPAAGRVLIDGRDIRDFTAESLRGQMSAVFQDSVLPGATIREAIAFGSPDASTAQIQEAAGRAHASALIERLPEQYDTPLQRSGELFSGGERQRLAIARALLRDGRVWLLDEPTSGLDAAAEEELTEVLFDATRGHTTLWVTHDPALTRRFDMLVVLDRGRVIYAGAPASYEPSDTSDTSDMSDGATRQPAVPHTSTGAL